MIQTVPHVKFAATAKGEDISNLNKKKLKKKNRIKTPKEWRHCLSCGEDWDNDYTATNICPKCGGRQSTLQAMHIYI
jgi:rRNA maturation endonuclease Nob1